MKFLVAPALVVFSFFQAEQAQAVSIQFNDLGRQYSNSIDVDRCQNVDVFRYFEKGYEFSFQDIDNCTIGQGLYDQPRLHSDISGFTQAARRVVVTRKNGLPFTVESLEIASSTRYEVNDPETLEDLGIPFKYPNLSINGAAPVEAYPFVLSSPIRVNTLSLELVCPDPIIEQSAVIDGQLITYSGNNCTNGVITRLNLSGSQGVQPAPVPIPLPASLLGMGLAAIFSIGRKSGKTRA